MRSIRDDEARRSIVRRLEGLSPRGRRRWGRLDLPAMLAHAGDQVRMALGVVPVARAQGPLRFALSRLLVIQVLPWPRGRARAPAGAFTTPPTGWESDRKALLELVDRYAATPPEKLAPLHPLFGPMRPGDWDVLTYRHLDHHLRQFSA